MTAISLSGCRLVVTMDDGGRELEGASIGFEDGWITSVGSDPEPESGVRTIDCRHLVAIPGLINTHHHLYQTLTRAFPQSEGRSLFDWLRLLYPIWAGLDEDMVHASTAGGLAELVLSGCTTSADHLYVFPPGSDGFIGAQVDAAQRLGIRFYPTRGSMDLGESHGGLPPDSVVQSIDAILSDSVRAIDTYHDPSPGSMVRIGLAPCSPFSVTPTLMREAAALARETGVRLHTHIAETLDEDRYSRETFGMSPVELLDDVGWMADDVWLAHCVHPRESDVRLLGRARAAVAHCPTSNMLLGSGLAPVRALQDAGVPVGLGVDGSASNDANDLRNEVKQAVLTARTRDGVEAMTARQALRLATRGGADCLGREDIGAIEVGKAADVALFDADALGYAGGQEDLPAAIVLGAVKPTHVFVNGRQVVGDAELLTQDSSAIAAALNLQSRKLLARTRSRTR